MLNNEEQDPELLRIKRSFYSHLSPFVGEEYASKYGGFAPLSAEDKQDEMQEVLTRWLSIQGSPSGKGVSDAAWWMLKIFDKRYNLDFDDGMSILDLLVSFGVSLLNHLDELGALTLHELPEIEIDIHSWGDMEAEEEEDALVSPSEFHLSNSDLEFLRNLGVGDEEGGHDDC